MLERDGKVSWGLEGLKALIRVVSERDAGTKRGEINLPANYCSFP